MQRYIKPYVVVQLTKLRSKSPQAATSAGSKLPAEQEAADVDVTLLRQRVTELEKMLRESKADVNAAVIGEETGQFS